MVSLMATLLTIRATMRFSHLTADHDLSGPQKFHGRPVPRVGGVGVMVALVFGGLFTSYHEPAVSREVWLLLCCSLPAFVAGMVEDVTKNVSPGRRLLATALSAALAVWLIDSVVVRTDIPGLDWATQWFPFAVALTVFVIAGTANAINIIDGFNGLASMCVFMMVLGLCYLSYQVGDRFLFVVCLITAGAVLGFFFFNFPAGLIFLGDGGAYLLGFLLGELCVLLVHRNPEVSPMCPLLLCAYPVFETMFTMYRRKFVRGVATGAPDGIHLHTLIHRRLVRWTVQSNRERRRLTRRNSMTSPYLWMLSMTSIIPALLWWNNTAILSGCILVFMAAYVWLYSRIVRFKTPRWMVFRRTQ